MHSDFPFVLLICVYHKHRLQKDIVAHAKYTTIILITIQERWNSKEKSVLNSINNHTRKVEQQRKKRTVFY